MKEWWLKKAEKSGAQLNSITKLFEEPRPQRGSLFYHQFSLCYFYKMLRFVFLILLFFSLITISSAQIRLNKLVIEAKEKYQILGTDIIVADTLVMNDSSSIILNLIKAG